MDTFKTALLAYVDYVQRVSNSYISKQFGQRQPEKFTLDDNPKYLRINRVNGQTSVYGFVRRSDGAIMYGAGWRTPFIAKGDKGKSDAEQSAATKRGSIYDPATWEACTGWSAVRTIR